MEEQKTQKKTVALVSILAVILLVGIVGINQTNPPDDGQELGTNIKYNSLVQVYKNGDPVWQGHNLITNGGKDMIKLAVAQSQFVNATVLALGNLTAPAAGDTSLNNEITNCGLAKKGVTYTSNGASNGNWTLTGTWTSSCNNEVVNTTGILNGTAGNLFAGTSFTSTTLQSNDQITVNYTIWIS